MGFVNGVNFPLFFPTRVVHSYGDCNVSMFEIIDTRHTEGQGSKS